MKHHIEIDFFQQQQAASKKERQESKQRMFKCPEINSSKHFAVQLPLKVHIMAGRSDAIFIFDAIIELLSSCFRCVRQNRFAIESTR